MKYLLLISFSLLLVIAGSQPALAEAPPSQEGGPSSSSPAVVTPYDWLQFNFDQRHSGNNTLETKITAANVAQLQKLFRVALPSIADNAPVYQHAVQTPQGYRNLLFLTSRAGQIIALDARTGAQLWMKQHGPGSCETEYGPHHEVCYTTASPALDPNRRYVYSYGLDGRVHKHRVVDGREITGNGWPELVTRKNYDEKGSSDLSFATVPNGTTFLYVTTSSYGDLGNYEGHLTAINLVTGSQRVFNAVCSDLTSHFFDVRVTAGPDCMGAQAGMTGIWARPGVVYDPDTGKIYLATGNGKFQPAAHHWGDTVLALRPSGAQANGNPLDSYTPTNFQELQDRDLDIGSTAPAILPTPANSRIRHLAVQSGKDGQLRLLNLDNLSGQGGPGHIGGEIGALVSLPGNGEVLTQPAVWVNPSDGSTWVFVANEDALAAFKLTLDASRTPRLQPMWQNGIQASSPIIANGVLFEDAAAFGGTHTIFALNPVTGGTLWHDTQGGGVHWESPIVANGILYITDDGGNLTAYSLNGK